MTTSLENIANIKAKTDQISDTFCMAKWHHVTFYLHQGMTHSCYHCKVHQIDLDAVDEDIRHFHNTQHKKEMRKLMLNGDRPGECTYCWDLEDNGDMSDGNFRNAEEWSTPYIDETAQMPWDGNPWPHYVEISFTNHCNLKCSYCCPGASSRWYNEIKKFGDYPTDDLQFNIENLTLYQENDNPYIDAFWKWLPEAYEHLHVLRFTGGEPLLSTNVYKVMDYIIENPHPKLEFNINSNLAVPARNVDNFIVRLKQMLDNKNINDFIMFTSVDTWGTDAEWARNGLDLELWRRNVETYLTEVPEGKLSFMIAYHINSITNFRGLLEYIKDLRERFGNRIFMDTPYLIEPAYLAAYNITEDYLTYIEDDIKYMEENDFKDTDIHGLQRTYHWIKFNMTAKAAEIPFNRTQFGIYVEEHDKRRSTNYIESCPGMEEFYKLCRS